MTCSTLLNTQILAPQGILGASTMGGNVEAGEGKEACSERLYK